MHRTRHPDLQKYKHKIQLRVRNFEVDSQGVVHNAIYLEYCETGRVEYARQFGVTLLPGGDFENAMRVMVRRNEITYHHPARIDDLIDVYTRVSYIKNSSFCFEHLIFNNNTGELLCDQKSVQVYLNSDGTGPERLPEKYRKLFSSFEGKDLEIIEA
jgi:acyl-CoA thioester hydrolase